MAFKLQKDKQFVSYKFYNKILQVQHDIALGLVGILHHNILIVHYHGLNSEYAMICSSAIYKYTVKPKIEAEP